MGSKQPRRYYCRCGTRLAKDNTEHQCARCQRVSRDKLLAPPEVSPEFWQPNQLRDAFTAQHMGRVARPTGYIRTTMPFTVPAASPRPCSASGWGCGNRRRAGLRPGCPFSISIACGTGRGCCAYRPSCCGLTCRGRDVSVLVRRPQLVVS